MPRETRNLELLPFEAGLSPEIAQLTESEQRFNDIARLASDWFWETDEKLRFIYVSDRVFEGTGVRPEFYLGKTRRELAASQEDTPLWDRHLQDMDERRPFKDFVYRRLGPDGSYQWMRISGTPYYDSGGNFGGYRGVGSNITVETEALDAAQQSTQRLRDIAESSFDRIWETDEEHRFTYISDTPGKESNIPVEVLIGRTRWEAADVDPQHDTNWRNHLRVLDDHKPFRYFRFSRLDLSGQERHFSVNGLPIFNTENVFKGYRGSAADITEQVKANKAVETANARLAAAVESLPEVFALWGPDDRLVICNEQFRRINKEVIETTEPGTKFEDHILALIKKGQVPSAVGREAEYLQERMLKHRFPDGPYEIERQDGQWGLIFEQRTDEGTVTVSVDITERKMAEEALRFSEERVRAIVDNVVDGIVTFDVNGSILSLNPAAQRLFNYPASNLIGLNILTLTPKSNRFVQSEIHKEYFLGNYQNITGNTFDIEIDKLGDIPVSLEISLNEMRNKQGVNFVGIFRDITQRKEVDRLKNEFISTISHELRTPLTSIKGSLGLLSGGVTGSLSDDARQLIDISYKNANRLNELVDDLLDTEKLASGSMEFNFESFNLSETVSEAVKENSGLAKEYCVKFILEDIEPNTTVLGDIGRITQVLANFLSNAAKFSPSGEEVRISVCHSNGMAKVSVSDDGPGIESGFHERIFDRFTQAQGSNTRQSGGTGLGLSISKSIIEKHDGEIGFDTAQGVGSTFYFTLPLLE